MDQAKQSSPPDLTEETAFTVPRHPDENCFSNNMIFGNKSPKTGIKRVMAIISHHPVIIKLKSVSSRFFSVYINLTIFFRQLIFFVNSNSSFVNRKVIR